MSSDSEFSSRFENEPFDDASRGIHWTIKNHFVSLERVVENLLENGREKSLAITKLEESFGWVGKAIRTEQIKSGRKV